MDLHETWKRLQEEKLSRTSIAGPIDFPAGSKHPVARLIRAFKIGLTWAIACELLYISLLIVMPQPIVRVGMIVVILANLVFLSIHYRVLKRISAQNNLDQNTRDSLLGIHATVTAAMRFQQQISWILFPLCAAGGFLLGISLKQDAFEKLHNPMVITSMLVTMAVLTPLAYYLAKWMNKIAYGKYSDQLKNLIDQLTEDKL
jgi:hypothetical protein